MIYNEHRYLNDRTQQNIYSKTHDIKNKQKNHFWGGKKGSNGSTYQYLQ